MLTRALLHSSPMAETTDTRVEVEEPETLWKCEGCGAVCTEYVPPAPCDFCGSTDIIALDPDSDELPNH